MRRKNWYAFDTMSSQIKNHVMNDCTLKPKTILTLYVICKSEEHTEKTTVYSILYIALIVYYYWLFAIILYFPDTVCEV